MISVTEINLHGAMTELPGISFSLWENTGGETPISIAQTPPKSVQCSDDGVLTLHSEMHYHQVKEMSPCQAPPKRKLIYLQWWAPIRVSGCGLNDYLEWPLFFLFCLLILIYLLLDYIWP